MTSHQLINQNSSEVEYYTPPEIIAAARECMGIIHLDPASSEAANRRVGALSYFTHEVDGITQPWRGNTWINHPFGRAEEACGPDCQKDHVHHDYDLHGNFAWVQKMEAEFARGEIPEMCSIAYACTSEAWFQPLMKRPQCYLRPRTNYYLADGSLKKGVSKGSAVTYFGSNIEGFARAFRHLGEIKVSYFLP